MADNSRLARLRARARAAQPQHQPPDAAATAAQHRGQWGAFPTRALSPPDTPDPPGPWPARPARPDRPNRPARPARPAQLNRPIRRAHPNRPTPAGPVRPEAPDPPDPPNAPDPAPPHAAAHAQTPGAHEIVRSNDVAREASARPAPRCETSALPLARLAPCPTLRD